MSSSKPSEYRFKLTVDRWLVIDNTTNRELIDICWVYLSKVSDSVICGIGMVCEAKSRRKYPMVCLWDTLTLKQIHLTIPFEYGIESYMDSRMNAHYNRKTDELFITGCHNSILRLAFAYALTGLASLDPAKMVWAFAPTLNDQCYDTLMTDNQGLLVWDTDSGVTQVRVVSGKISFRKILRADRDRFVIMIVVKGNILHVKMHDGTIDDTIKSVCLVTGEIIDVALDEAKRQMHQPPPLPSLSEYVLIWNIYWSPHTYELKGIKSDPVESVNALTPGFCITKCVFLNNRKPRQCIVSLAAKHNSFRGNALGIAVLMPAKSVCVTLMTNAWISRPLFEPHLLKMLAKYAGIH